MPYLTIKLHHSYATTPAAVIRIIRLVPNAWIKTWREETPETMTAELTLRQQAGDQIAFAVDMLEKGLEQARDLGLEDEPLDWGIALSGLEPVLAAVRTLEDQDRNAEA